MKRPIIGFSLKLYFSYFLFSIVLVTALTIVHIHFSKTQQEERFKLQARELLMGKIALLKEYVSEGSPIPRLPWLMEHLHSSEGFDALCIDHQGKILSASSGGWYWERPTSHRQPLIEAALSFIDQIDPSKGFVVEFGQKIVLLPLTALISPSGTPMMVYVPKKELDQNSMADNLSMTGIMAMMMILLAIPFAYVISRPLNRAHAELDRRTTNLQQQIDLAAQDLTKKDRMIAHQSKLAAIGEMIGNISHQWRLPLTRVQLVLQNLQSLGREERLDSDRLHVSVQQAKEQIAFMSDTIDTFQDFYRTNPSERQFYLDECLENVVKIITPSLQQKGIAFNVNSLQHLKLSGSKQELGQVLFNLISNAQYELTHRKTGQPLIAIEISRREKEIIITVQDNAGGIPEEHLPSLFEPYFSTKQEQGTGLGLYMSRTIIEERFEGALEAENRQDGAIFTIKLPFREDFSADPVAIADS